MDLFLSTCLADVLAFRRLLYYGCYYINLFVRLQLASAGALIIYLRAIVPLREQLSKCV